MESASQRKIVATCFLTFRQPMAAGPGKQEADHSWDFRGLHCPAWLSQEQKADQQVDIPELHCHVSEDRQIIKPFSEIALPRKQCNFFISKSALPEFSGSKLVYGLARTYPPNALPGGQRTWPDFSNSTARPKIGLRIKWLIPQSGLPSPFQMAVQ